MCLYDSPCFYMSEHYVGTTWHMQTVMQAVQCMVNMYITLLYTNRQSSPFHVFHWWRASREIVEIRLSPLHQRARWIMHYSPVNNKKITCAITRTCGLWTAETHECLVNDIVYRVKFNIFLE